MKVLITGCRGQLGLELARQFNEFNGVYNLIETDVHNLDITNQVMVFELVKAQKPDVIINCAAYTNVDGCESDELNAYRVNAIGPQNLSAAALSVGAKMVQVSTDYVFDGTGNTPKVETDPMNPRSVYGKSKAMGEILVKDTNPRHFIVRTAWLYGEGNNFVRTMLKLAKEKDEVKVVNDQFGSPTSTKDLARCIIKLINSESYGTYHGTCEGSCSWNQFAKKIFEIKGINIKVSEMTTEELNRPAERPKYSVLDNFMLKLVGINEFRSWEEALTDYLKGEV
ncbi:dTDP-4-dehydrorhamnose reductase [Pseudobacteroides cellulosolvens]|uniref:dTDP-4-dehydrorhamnose reductase n=1 Tax=Pseudobacteroides cellulosolvens ATCC 35603 = DSM 2933 TaxID=398512 RepID=A0A0L6JV97_9FIRM|nr:dTDP-4-dehydrorhamnose reductase [Pseudobacteroides cellulosolvens]KNY29654.1 dTDP-4-dehydrorhamnose reductase [Pseudobacteroides cellulosolvens ATCC 35603 = DSM 2933]